MAREMRRADRQMTEEDTKALLEKAEYGILSTVSQDNTPYGVPMSFAYANDSIYLHCAPNGQRLDNIAANKNACFTVVDAVELLPAAFSTNYRSAIVFGNIAVVEDKQEKQKGLTAFITKYSPGFLEEGMRYIDKAFEQTTLLKIEINKMTGKSRG